MLQAIVIEAEAQPGVVPSPEPERPRGLRLRAVLNGDGGTIQRAGPDALRAQLAAAFERCGVAAELVIATGPEMRPQLEQALAEARAGRIDAVVVGGGDGSVSTAAGVLAGTGVPLGVLPVGTLNHFAKDLGMPLEIEAAAEALATAEVAAVDVGEVNGRVFVNNSLLGVYPYMVADRERRRELHGIGKWTAMSLAFLRMLWRFPRRRVTLCVEGRTTPFHTPCLVVGVNEYDAELFSVRRRGGLDNGHLWLLVAKHGHSLSFAWFAFRAAFRGLNESDDFEVLLVTSAEVRIKASRVPVAADGEVERMRGPLRYRIRPGDLRVLRPPVRRLPDDGASGVTGGAG
jgi:diacylglycerol kinase family enzyme